MSKQYDIVSRTREYTELNVIVGYESKTGKPALKMVKERVPFFVRRDNKRDYTLAEMYLAAGILENVKGIDSVSRYLTIRYEMPFNEFAAHATQTIKENDKEKTKQ